MFKIPRVNVIESDEGFSVEVLGRTGLLYVEGEKTVHISSEMLVSFGPALLALYTSSIKTWDSPNDNEVIDSKKRDIIVDNVRRAFHFQGFEIEVH
jgi:Immunity protein 74